MAAAAPMPTRKDAVRNRKKILVATGEVLRDDYENVSIPVIAERAGVGTATVYRYFPSLETLVREYLQGVIVELRDYSQDSTKSGTALFEDVVAQLGRLLVINGPAMVRLRRPVGFLTRLREGDPTIQTVRDAWERPIRAVLRSKGIDDSHFDHALFLYNQMFDPREVLDLLASGLSLDQTMRLLTSAYYGALDGMVAAEI